VSSGKKKHQNFDNSFQKIDFAAFPIVQKIPFVAKYGESDTPPRKGN